MTLDLFDKRALLFLPASNERAIAKARASDADLVILDLEDAVKAEDKEAAREMAVAAVDQPWPMPVAIRINGARTDWHGQDVVAMMHSEVELIIVPRAEAKSDLHFVRNQTGRPIGAMIETARGVLAAHDIAHEAAAIATGLFTLLFDLGTAPQLILFAVYAVLAVLVGKRWYGEPDVAHEDRGLNDPARRLVGKTVLVVAPVDDHAGRVRVGDGEWSARGGPAAAGERVIVTGVDGNCLTVEPARTLPPA